MRVTIPLILQLLTTAIALASPWLAVHLSLKRFYTEKSWERKFQLYADIFRALHRLQYNAGEYLASMEEGYKISPERQHELSALWREAQHTVEEGATLGLFLLSPESATLLEQLVNTLRNIKQIGSYDEELYEEFKAVNQCIRELKDTAHADLKFEKRKYALPTRR